MNARQAAKAAAKRIEDLEDFNRRCSRDIKAYNRCIDHMISGGSPCDWCDDQTVCQLQAKADGKGCAEWMLMDNPPVQDQEGEDADESAGILSAGPEG